MGSETAMITGVHPHSGRSIDPEGTIAQEWRGSPEGRPWILTNMISSLDGATAIDGLSGDLGGPADLRVFRALRSRTDLIIVGAATAIEEVYRPPETPPAVREARLERGQSERPIMAVVTRSLSITPGHPLFSDPSYRPIVITNANAPADRVDALSEVADIVAAGHGSVDLPAAMGQLAHHRLALLEGGPTLNAAFVAADLIDEWNLTTAPVLVGGGSLRPATGPGTESSHRFDLDRLWEGEGLLFSRWLRARGD